MIEDVDCIVIGAGQGGGPFALAQAKAGKRVVVFERDRVGGSCVNYGCTPSKAFLASAHWAGRARRGGPLHVRCEVTVDVPAVMRRVRAVRDEWHDGNARRYADSTVDLVYAEASFAGERVVAGGGRELRAPLIVLDTGSSPAIPPIDGLAGTPYLTNLTFFDQLDLPRRLAVIGAGYIGCELGQGSQRLGSRVTIVDGGEEPMGGDHDAMSCETDAADVLRLAMEADGVTFRLGTHVRRVGHANGVFALTLDDGSSLEADGLLIAAGRTPNATALQCERSGIELDARGYVKTDEHLRTTCEGVYAIGEIGGQAAFTHVSWEDFRRLQATTGGTPRRKDDRVLAYSSFTEPQYAQAGLTETQAREAGLDAKSVVAQLADVARGEEWNLAAGFYRLVIDARTERIVGATLVGYEAGEIVHVLAFAIQQGCTWRDLDAFVAIHPTFGEGLPSLARLFESA